MSAPKLVDHLPEGNYEIISDNLPSSQPIGVNTTEPESTPVRSNAPDWVWYIKPVPGEHHGYYLSIVNAYPYTGFSGDVVIATKDESKNHLWHIYQVAEEKYVITKWPRWPNSAWTVDPKPGDEVKLYPESPSPIKQQEFTIKRLLK